MSVLSFDTFQQRAEGGAGSPIRFAPSGVGTFGVVACGQEVAVTPGLLLADADLIYYTRGASEKEEAAIRKAVPGDPKKRSRINAKA